MRTSVGLTRLVAADHPRRLARGRRDVAQEFDSRKRYVLAPVVADGTPAFTDPSHSSIEPACEWVSAGAYGDIRYEHSTGESAAITAIGAGSRSRRASRCDMCSISCAWLGRPGARSVA